MDDKDRHRRQLQQKIAKYRALARQTPDDETMRRIKDLVSELERSLHAGQAS
jgi:hypothetical protein